MNRAPRRFRYNPRAFASRAAPLRWYIALLYTSLHVLGLLPLAWLHALGAAVGRLLAATDNSLRRRAQHTLALADAPCGDQSHDAFLRAALIEGGRGLAEVAKIWTCAPDQALALVRKVEGLALFEAASASGRGVIVAAPHMGCWELLNYWLCAHADDPALVYRPPRQTSLEPLLLRVRGRMGAKQIRAAGTADMRALFKHVTAGGTVMIMPDQEPKRGEGVFAPFFGHPALTMVLLSRLARRTGATVLFAFAERLAHADGYVIHFLPAPDGIADPDLPTAVAALNRGVEDCVRLVPQQYQWHYKRFSQRPATGQRTE
jgi:KDO2-lipid IV(A) lauroyltransferase